ncbi:MAG: MurG: undecaprenyldiphospho-muramoylpentapeptide beta-N-acetylglucosaminyltransferase [candidate division TM6 bacterium GW2011_GWF2_38_10]|nr:MAG: MurG: undecaprenyldiphospho-muramoylpentapeptide beta-N-acetylglucosaminyltransferase [candidate division TM6 bacterium GW2011_GWF2_38_10]
MMKQKTLFAVASGSGGHIIPALVLIQQWKQDNPYGRVIFCTGTKKLDLLLLRDNPDIDKVITFSLTQWNSKKFWKLPLLLLQLVQIFFKSLFITINYRPHTIINTGGILAIPLSYAAKCSSQAIYTYELNVIPGKAVKALLPCSTTIYSPFLATKHHCQFLGKDFSHKCTYAPYPLRFTQKEQTITKEDAVCTINKLIPHSALRLTATKKTLFLLGGSQGSALLNKALLEYLSAPEQAELCKEIQIIHQTGTHTTIDWKRWYQDKNISAFTFSYHNDIATLYAGADLIITRAGAGTLFEIAFFQKPCIVVPLQATTTSHQIDNAKAMLEHYPTLITIIDQNDVQHDPTLLGKTLYKKLYNHQN